MRSWSWAVSSDSELAAVVVEHCGDPNHVFYRPSADEHATCVVLSADDLTVLRTPRGEWKFLCLFRAA